MHSGNFRKRVQWLKIFPNFSDMLDAVSFELFRRVEISSRGRAASPRPGWGSIFRLAASRQASRSVPTGRQQGGPTMPHYEFHCERCKKDVTLTLSIGERERGDYKCPGCGGKKLEPLMGTFFSQTSRKA